MRTDGDYISREEAEKRLYQRAEIANSAYIDQTPHQIMMLAQNVVHLIPAADVRPHWISVEERLPEKNQIVVAVESGRTWDYGQFRGLAYLGGNKRKWNWKNNTTKTVDYWMLKKDALPEPPKEET